MGMGIEMEIRSQGLDTVIHLIHNKLGVHLLYITFYIL